MISRSSIFTVANSAVVATGLDFPDALAASTLAGTTPFSPIILTETARLTDEASDALSYLKSKRLQSVFVVGGMDAISQETADAIKALGLTVTRVAGSGAAANRYGTAAAIANAADAIADSGTIDGVKAAFFATGLNFPDAISAAAGAYAGRIPVLLVNSTVPAETTKAIDDLGIKQAYILGGTNAVSAEVATELATLTGSPPVRIQGAAPYTTDRFGTSAAIADFEVAHLRFDKPSGAVLANGTDAHGGYDALAVGPLGGLHHWPTLLTASLPQSIQAWLDAHSDTIGVISVSGGFWAVDSQTVADAVKAAKNTAND